MAWGFVFVSGVGHVSRRQPGWFAPDGWWADGAVK